MNPRYVQITIEMDNAAFDDSPEAELSRILFVLGQEILARGPEHCNSNLKDINGNTVGALSYYKGDDS